MGAAPPWKRLDRDAKAALMVVVCRRRPSKIEVRAHAEVGTLLHELVDFVNTIISFIAVGLVELGTGFDVQDDGDRDASASRPLRIRCLRAVAPEISGVLGWIRHTLLFEYLTTRPLQISVQTSEQPLTRDFGKPESSPSRDDERL